MNFISYREAVSIFPKTTFLRRVVFPSSREELGPYWESRWSHKFCEQGYTVHVNEPPPDMCIGVRSPLDRHAWVIRFEGMYIVSGSKTATVIGFTDKGGDNSSIRKEANRSVYGDPDLAGYRFELVWLSQVAHGHRQWRLSIFEPSLFWYLFLTDVLDRESY